MLRDIVGNKNRRVDAPFLLKDGGVIGSGEILEGRALEGFELADHIWMIPMFADRYLIYRNKMWVFDGVDVCAMPVNCTKICDNPPLVVT